MRLSDLDSGTLDVSVAIVQTPSSKMQMFLQDKLKAKYGCRSDAVIDVESKSDYKRIKAVLGVFPPFAERWFIQVNIDKFSDKEFIALVRQSTTCVFFCTCSKYKHFKSFKEALKGVDGVCDFYINSLRRADFVYLYDAFTHKDNQLTKQLFDYVLKSYTNDVEAIWDLLLQLNQGTKVTSRKDITEICGLGGLSIESYIFDLLKDLSGSARGLETVLKNRMKAGADLIDSIGLSSMYNFMVRSIGLLCELKMLMTSGVVYKTVRQLPDSFDEPALARYQKYIWRLREIPLSHLLKLRQCLGETRWKTELEFIGFIYTYYYGKSMDVLQERGIIA